MTKQHVFDQVVWHGRAVEGHKGAAGSARGFMQHTGQHFLARTRGAYQQGSDFGLCNSFGQSQQVLTGRIDKHDVAHGLGAGASHVLVEQVVQTHPRSAAGVTSGQHGQGARLTGLHSQLQFLALHPRDDGGVQPRLLQKLLNRLQTGHIHTQVQHHHGRIGRVRHQGVECVHRHQRPAAGVQGLAVLGAHRFFRVQPKGQRGRCRSWLHGVASHSDGTCKATLVPAQSFHLSAVNLLKRIL